MAEVKQESSDNAEVATYSSELKDALAWVRENAQGKCVHETQLIELQILFDRRSQRADLKSWRDSALLRAWNVQRRWKSEDGKWQNRDLSSLKADYGNALVRKVAQLRLLMEGSGAEQGNAEGSGS